MSRKIKICGMRQHDNVTQVRALNPDYLGYIFYTKSARLFPEAEIESIVQTDSIRNTAVFVDADPAVVERILASGKFQAVQLHGNETPSYCRSLRSLGYETIKAFGVGQDFDYSQLEPYLDAVDFFLFDTKTPGYGGSGESFPWEILELYPHPKRYFLSGGVGPDNFQEASQIKDERLYAIDLNSRFESSPGIKNIALLERVLKNIAYE